MDRFLDGYNVTFIAYGQTGTGKTHTLFGSDLEKLDNFEADSGQVPEKWGLFPRALTAALAWLKDHGGGKGECEFTNDFGDDDGESNCCMKVSMMMINICIMMVVMMKMVILMTIRVEVMIIMITNR